MKIGIAIKIEVFWANDDQHRRGYHSAKNRTFKFNQLTVFHMQYEKKIEICIVLLFHQKIFNFYLKYGQIKI